MKPLFIPLKGEYFDQFAKGEKVTEYRPYGLRWNERTCSVGREVVLSRGYGKAHRLRGTVAAFEARTDVTQSPVWLAIYGKRHLRAACITVSIDGAA